MLGTYEGIRFMPDKQVVVLDIGTAYTKYGYAGECMPRGIIKSEIKDPETKIVRNIYDYKDLEDFYQLLVEFLHAIFFRHAVISPKDIRLVLLESLLLPTKTRETIAKALFRHFEIGSLMILPIHLVCVSTLGVETALVLDIGYEEATLIPVFEGVPILKAWQALPIAAKAVHGRIKESLSNIVPESDLSEKFIEEVKVRTCFVTTFDRANKFNTKEEEAPPPDVKYYTNKTITIPGSLREKAFEVLWEKDLDNHSLPTMILDAILKCSVDARRPLAENILLVGGTAQTKGLTARLKAELHSLVRSDYYKDNLYVRTFKFHSAPCKPNYTAWLGGAIFGIADLPSRCITKEQYARNSRIPDWVNLQDNLREDTTNI